METATTQAEAAPAQTTTAAEPAAETTTEQTQTPPAQTETQTDPNASAQTDSPEPSLEDLDNIQSEAAKHVREGTAKPASTSDRSGTVAQTTEQQTEQTTTAQPAATTETPAATTAEPAQTTEAATTTQPETPAATTTEPPATTEKKDEELSDRFRWTDPIDQAINTLRKARPELSWAQAEEIVKGKEESTPAAPSRETELTESISTLTTEVTDLENKIREAGKSETFFTGDVAEMQIQLADKKTDLKLAKRDLERVQQDTDRAAKSQFTTAVEKSKAKALQRFPDANKADTKLGAAVRARIAELDNPSHPDHARLFSTTAPYDIVRDVAEELNIKPVEEAPVKPAATTTPAATATATPTTQAAPATTQTPAKPVMSPASGARSSAPAQPTNPQTEAQEKAKHLLSPDATLAELDDAQGGSLHGSLSAIVR